MGRMPLTGLVQFPCHTVDSDGDLRPMPLMHSRTAVERRVAALLPQRRLFSIHDADGLCVASSAPTQRGPYHVRWFTWPFEP